jgi:FMN phosphatase YigB (HAD superfamily)
MAGLKGIKAIMFDTGGVLYHRPRQDRHLAGFLAQHGIKLRPRSVVSRALRAANFDVIRGRITREEFYTAVLRLHGLEDETLFAEGHKALLRDAADIELFPGVTETLYALQDAGYELVALSDTPHPAGLKVMWLADHGLAPSLWSDFVVSSESGMLKTEPKLYGRTLARLGYAPDQAAFVGHDSAELACVAEVGLVTIAFMPDDPCVSADYAAASFFALKRLFLN